MVFAYWTFSQALAGPTTTRLMAEMGAEVIKVELAPNGEASRALPYLRNGRSGYYIQQNRGKKSIAIDRKDPRSVELVMKVLEKCDVLVENFAPGAIGPVWALAGTCSAQGQSAPDHGFDFGFRADRPARVPAGL